MAVNRGAAYLAGMSRSVGKGWPSGHLFPDPGTRQFWKKKEKKLI